MKFLGTTMIFLAAAGSAFAILPPAPEIDANSAGSAMAMVTGGLLILRGRKK